MVYKIGTVQKFLEWWYKEDPNMMAKAIIYHREILPKHERSLTVKQFIEMVGTALIPIHFVLSGLEHDSTPESVEREGGEVADLNKLHPATMLEWVGKTSFNVLLECDVMAVDEEDAREEAKWCMDDAEVTCE